MKEVKKKKPKKNITKLTKKTKITKLTGKTWIIITCLSIAGNIAWAIENSYFNVFVFDEISQNPRPVAWMVAVSAITATLTTFIMGSLSDRTNSKLGKRRPYILFGYILWGIVIALFPLVAYIQIIGVAIIMVIVADAVMTFFGSTANDAAFNAWVTDITDTSNRGRLQGVLSMSALIGNIIAIGLAGFVIDEFGYYIFFYVLGGFVTIIGLISGFMIKEEKEKEKEKNEKKKKSIFKEIYSSFKPENIKQNKILYLLFLYMAISNIGYQIYSPFLFTYIEYFLGYSKTVLSVISALVILIGAVGSVVYGLLSHKFNRKNVLIITAILNLIINIIFSYMRSIPELIILQSLQILNIMISGIALGSWLQDLYPKKERGLYQGIRMIFFVLLPMVIGPPIGAFIIENYGEPTFINGQQGYIPSPQIFQVGAIIGLLAIIPMFFISKKFGIVKLKEIKNEHEYEPKNKPIGESKHKSMPKL